MFVALGVKPEMYRVALLILGVLASMPAFSSELDWPVLAISVSDYADDPSPKNAQRVIDLIPEKHVPYENSDSKSKALGVIYAAVPMSALRSQVSAAEQTSVRLGFRMRNISDGAFTEDLNIILGRLIHIDPELFLFELDAVDPVYVSGLVGNFGEDFVDQLEESCEEKDRRVESLKHINVASLEKIRGRVVKALENLPGLVCSDT